MTHGVSYKMDRRASRRGVPLFLVLSLAAQLALVTACSVGKSSDNATCGAESPDVTAKRRDIFDRTLHQYLLQQTCVQCHTKAAGKAPYFHSDANLVLAYDDARELSDFGNPAGSRIVKKLLTDHNCGSDSQCRAMAAKVQDLIAEWAKDEAELPAPPTCQGDLETGLDIVLPGVSVAPTDLSKTTDKELRWDVGAINSVVGKVTFSVKIRLFTDPSASSAGAYKLSYPTLATQDKRLEVLSVVPILNNSPAPSYSNWAGANFVVGALIFDATATVLGFPPISDFKMIVDWINTKDGTTTPTGDTIGFTLRVKETTDAVSATTKAPGCKSPTYWKIVYNNVFDEKILSGGVYVGRCTVCHGDTTQPANIAMNLSAVSNDACLQALMRTNFDTPSQSLVLTKPSWADATAAQNAGERHPVKIDLLNDPTLAKQKSYLLQWINDEAAQYKLGQ